MKLDNKSNLPSATSRWCPCEGDCLGCTDSCMAPCKGGCTGCTGCMGGNKATRHNY